MSTCPCHVVMALVLLCVAQVARGVEPLPETYRVPATIMATLTAQDPGMHMPTAAAVDSRGVLYVADGARDRIVTFSADRKTVTATTRPAGQALTRPVGIAVDSADNLWIADTENARLLVLDAASKLVETIELPGIDEKHPAGPTAILVTADRKRTYVVDNPNHRLLVRENGTKRWTPVGRRGVTAGEFQYPFMLAQGQNGDVLITEAIGCRVQILTAAGKWAGAVGSWGVELGQFSRPKGVAVDAAGRIFVSDSTLNVVEVFDARGRVAGCLTGADGRPMRFEHPMGMAFDRAGLLYVTELAANRVAVVALAKEGGKP